MTTKQCTSCKRIKDTKLFNKRSASRDGLNSWCKGCKRSVDNRYYRDSPARKVKVKDSAHRAEADKRQWIWDYLLQNPCVDCGETDPVVLEFDHVRGTKLANISRMVGYNSMAKVEAEIEKCEVRCANCHRRVTASRGNWYRFRLGSPDSGTLLS